jgi:Big-like domain-containing protein/galactose oxidase-like protein
MNTESCVMTRTMERLGQVIAIALFALVSCVMVQTSQAQVTNATLPVDSLSPVTPPHAVGQTATLLPDGRWLLVGGIVAGHVSDTIELADGSGERRIELNLQIARTAHTATVLPNGSVFVFGGTDERGNLIADAEIIDVARNNVDIVQTAGLTPRTRHTATLLTDGRVLIAGGMGSDGRAIAAAQLWNPQAATVDTWNPLLQTPRYDHSAEILGTGEGRIVGGRSSAEQASLPTELFNPSTNIFEPRAPNESSGGVPPDGASRASVIAETLPAAEAVDVAVNTRITFRFNQPLSMTSLSTSTVSLIGPSGAVSTKVVGAESGMLAFVTPDADLAPGATYTAFLSGVTDLSGRPVPLASLRFTTHRYEASTPVATRAELTNEHPALASASAMPVTAASSPTAPPAIPVKAKPLTKADTQQRPAEEDSAEDWIPQDANTVAGEC